MCEKQWERSRHTLNLRPPPPQLHRSGKCLCPQDRRCSSCARIPSLGSEQALGKINRRKLPCRAPSPGRALSTAIFTFSHFCVLFPDSANTILHRLGRRGGGRRGDSLTSPRNNCLGRRKKKGCSEEKTKPLESHCLQMSSVSPLERRPHSTHCPATDGHRDPRTSRRPALHPGAPE